MKFISIYTIDRRMHEAEPAAANMAAMGGLIGEMLGAGVLLDFGGVNAVCTELRVRENESEITVTGGPFTETKEIRSPVLDKPLSASSR